MMDPSTNRDDASGNRAASMDPADWDAFRTIGMQFLETAISHLSNIDRGPVWRPPSQDIKDAIHEPIPRKPQGLEASLEEISQRVLPFTNGNTHPAFFGWVHGAGTAGGMLADLMSGAINSNLGGRDHAPMYIERCVIEWAKELFGFPDDASGILLSGTSMANLVGLTIARNRVLGHDVRQNGLGENAGRLVAYASTEVHSSVDRALEMLGIGSKQLHKVPVLRNFQIDIDQLQLRVRQDRSAGLIPFAIIGTAGTVNTAAIDDLQSLGEFARREQIWFHVDGAFGASVILSPELRALIDGIEHADSIAFDFHKWAHVGYDAGCLLVRDGELHRQTFASRPDYLRGADEGLAGGSTWFCDYGPELSRGFRALKVWMALKEHGTDRIGANILKNCRQAEYVVSRVATSKTIEVAAPVSLNIACLRRIDARLTDTEIDALNSKIVAKLQCKGIAAPSTTTLDGQTVIRICITNHRTQTRHLDRMLDSIESMGDTIARRIVEQRLDTTHRRDAAGRTSTAHSPDEGRYHTLYRHVMKTCERSELVRVTRGLTFSIEGKLTPPFQVKHGSHVAFRPDVVESTDVLPIWIRHAAEVALRQRHRSLNPNRRSSLTDALLACFTATVYAETYSRTEQDEFRSGLSDSLLLAHTMRNRPIEMWRGILEHATCCRELLELQSDDATYASQEVSDSEWADILKRLDQSLICSRPTESILVSGGDDRISIDERTLTNKYGCPARPDTATYSFSSSTATTVSRSDFNAAEALRQELLFRTRYSPIEKLTQTKLDDIRDKLAQATGMEVGGPHAVVLTASGTDCELLSLMMSSQYDSRPVVNIVLSPAESGSGLLHAAAARHYSSTTARGATVETGMPIDGLFDVEQDLQIVEARDDNGILKSQVDLERELEEIVDTITAGDRRCLVHLLHCSKTGWSAPAIETAKRLSQRHPYHVDIVVDACQLRQDVQLLGQMVDLGFMVQLSGSKFFAAPAFCGALLVPATMICRLNERKPVPAGLAQYSGRQEWPSSLSICTQSLQAAPNLGLLFRWTLALRNMEQLALISPTDVDEVCRRFEREIQAWFDANDEFEFLATDTGCVFDDASKAHGDTRTLIPFLLRIKGGIRQDGVASFDEAKQVDRWMKSDLGDRVPDALTDHDHLALATRFHLGQPVKIDKDLEHPVGAIRVCLSARHFIDIQRGNATDHAASAQLDIHLEAARMALRKLQLIASNFDRLPDPKKSLTTIEPFSSLGQRRTS